jgi:hypothetical protein
MLQTKCQKTIEAAQNSGRRSDMNTKQIVWQFFQHTIMKYGKLQGKNTLDFTTLMSLIRKFAQVYDNRTAKNYIDCMMDNGWLVPQELNPFDIMGSFVVSSVWKYKRTTWTINENAQYDLIDEDKALAEFLKGEN